MAIFCRALEEKTSFPLRIFKNEIFSPTESSNLHSPLGVFCTVLILSLAVPRAVSVSSDLLRSFILRVVESFTFNDRRSSHSGEAVFFWKMTILFPFNQKIGKESFENIYGS